MPVSEAQKRANKRYRKRAVKSTLLAFYPKDYDLWDYLCTKESKAGYMKELLRRDFEQNKKDKET